MKIIIEEPSEWDLKGMLWSGAEKALEEIVDADKFDEFNAYIDELYYDGIGLTELNDLLRFDFDSVKESLGMLDFEEFKDLLDKKALDKAEKVIEKIEKEWEEFKDSDENIGMDGKKIFDSIDDWAEETYSSEPWPLVEGAVRGIKGEVDTIADDEVKTDDWDSMVEAIGRCGLENFFEEFQDLVDSVRYLDDWIVEKNL